jgi:4,5-DOPA dioxygenase extradiol
MQSHFFGQKISINFLSLKYAPDHHESLIDWEHYGDAAHLSIPSAEHYWPALYTLALQEDGEHAQIFADGIEMSSISMLSFSIQ